MPPIDRKLTARMLMAGLALALFVLALAGCGVPDQPHKPDPVKYGSLQVSFDNTSMSWLRLDLYNQDRLEDFQRSVSGGDVSAGIGTVSVPVGSYDLRALGMNGTDNVFEMDSQTGIVVDTQTTAQVTLSWVPAGEMLFTYALSAAEVFMDLELTYPDTSVVTITETLIVADGTQWLPLPVGNGYALTVTTRTLDNTPTQTATVPTFDIVSGVSKDLGALSWTTVP